MKKTILLAAALLSAITIAWAAETIWIHQNNRITLGMPISMAESVTLSDDGATVNFNMKENAGTHSATYSDIEKVTLGSSSTAITVAFDGVDADVVNPFAFQGVTVEKDGGNITVTSTSLEELRYELSGTASDGSFTITSAAPFTIALNGASITSTAGSAINISSTVDATVELNSASSITDGTAGENGCLYSKGNITFKGDGTLSVTANTKHAIFSKKSITIASGTINTLSSASDGIHSTESFVMNGGALTIRNAGGDGIDGDSGTVEINDGTIDVEVKVEDTKGIKCDGNLTINGGTVQLNMPADQGKGFKTKAQLSVNGGTINAAATGNVVVVNNDPSYCSIFKSDTDFVMNNGNITINHTGTAGKGISADGNVTIAGGNIAIEVSGANGTYTDVNGATDSYAPTCVTADGNISISAGTIDLTVKSAQGKALKSDIDTNITGGTITATMSGDAAVVNYDPSYCTVIKTDGNFTMSAGSVTATHSGMGGKGISVDGDATFTGGTVNIATSGNGSTYTASTGTDTYSATCITIDGNLYLNGGTFTLTSTGTAGKCIKVDQELIATPDSNILTVTAETKGKQLGSSSGNNPPTRPGQGNSSSSSDTSSSPKVIKATGNMTVNGGTFNLKSANEGGEGLESKAIMTINGGEFYFNTYDDCINAATQLIINGGNIRAVSTGNDAIDSNGTMSITGGLTLASGTGGAEEGVDVDKSSQFSITGGTLVNQAGNMLRLTATQCKVPTVKYSSSISSGTLVTITDSSGNHIISFKAPQAMSQGCYITHPSLKTGSSYKLYTGGSVSGGSVFNEITQNGTFTGGTQVKSFTISTNMTSL